MKRGVQVAAHDQNVSEWQRSYQSIESSPKAFSRIHWLWSKLGDAYWKLVRINDIKRTFGGIAANILNPARNEIPIADLVHVRTNA